VTAAPAREMPVTVVLARERTIEVRTGVVETAWVIAVFPAEVEVVIPVLSVSAPEAAPEPAVHAALQALAEAEEVAGGAAVAVAEAVGDEKSQE
jgi:hypothetical protein